jgi:hypothetical protein
MERKTIIGVLGGNHSTGASGSEAESLGASIVRSHKILLTGGYCTESTDIKHAAMQGPVTIFFASGNSKFAPASFIPKKAEIPDQSLDTKSANPTA